jgi:hypothetical protein
MTDKQKKREDDSFTNEGLKALDEMKRKREELSKPKKHGWWYDESTKYLIFQIDKGKDYDIEL